MPEFRVANDDGTPLLAEDITRQVQRYADNDAVLFRRIGGCCPSSRPRMVDRATQAARARRPGPSHRRRRLGRHLPYSRSVNLVGMHRWPLMTTLELPQYREWLETRKRLANPGGLHLDLDSDAPARLVRRAAVQPDRRRPSSRSRSARNRSRFVSWPTPRMASGCRGLGYWSDRFLADSHQGRDRLLCCALLNQEMDMLESMLVTAEEPPQWIDTSVAGREGRGPALQPRRAGDADLAREVLAVRARTGRRRATLSMIVPQVPKTTQAWEVSPGDVRGLKIDRVDKGLEGHACRSSA